MPTIQTAFITFTLYYVCTKVHADAPQCSQEWSITSDTTRAISACPSCGSLWWQDSAWAVTA